MLLYISKLFFGSAPKLSISNDRETVEATGLVAIAAYVFVRRWDKRPKGSDQSNDDSQRED